MNKLLVILGPTATGKTSTGVNLAKKFNGEIVSADSKQVYKDMDVLTGKDIDKYSELVIKNKTLEIENSNLDVGYRLKDSIPIWLVDVVEPNYPFNAGQYSLLAKRVIEDIWTRGKLPIVVGGTGLYIKSIIDPLGKIRIPPNKKIRRELTGLSIDDLQSRLRQEDRNKWEKMNNSDRKNPRRLARAIEIAHWRKNNPGKSEMLDSFKLDLLLMIGLRTSTIGVLSPSIDKRVEDRLKEGAIEEVKCLINKRYSWNLPAFGSTGAQELKEYIEGRDTLTRIAVRWRVREHEYASRQITWFKKDKRIEWFDITEKDYLEKIIMRVKKWYTEGN